MEHSACGRRSSHRWRRHDPLGPHADRHIEISKALSLILRHQAADLEIKIRSDGYCALDDVLATRILQKLQVTRTDVESVVKKSKKRRFNVMNEDGTRYIRAANGHSLTEVEDCRLSSRQFSLADPDLPDQCVHGTYRQYFDKIQQIGLIAGGDDHRHSRNHIHFNRFRPGDRRNMSGMRHDCDVAIWIDLRKALHDGIPFYLSTNQIIFSPGRDGIIPTEYFTWARDLRNGEDLLLSSCSQRRPPTNVASPALQGHAPFKSPPTNAPLRLTPSLTSSRIAAAPAVQFKAPPASQALSVETPQYGSSLVPHHHVFFKSPPRKVPPSLASPPTSPGGGRGAESSASRATAVALPAATADVETKAESKGPEQQPGFVSFEDEGAGSGDGAAGREPSTDSSSSGWVGEEDPAFRPLDVKPGDRCKEECGQPAWLAKEHWCPHRCSLTRHHAGPHMCVDHARTSPAYWDVDDLPAGAPEFVPSDTVAAGRTAAEVSPWDLLLTECHQTGLDEMD